MNVGMSRERRFQTTPDGQPYENIGPREYSGFKKCLDDYIEGVEDNALPIHCNQPEVRFYNPEDEDDQCNTQPRWVSLQDLRNRDCSFDIRGVEYKDWGKWYFRKNIGVIMHSTRTGRKTSWTQCRVHW